jgi:PilM
MFKLLPVVVLAVLIGSFRVAFLLAQQAVPPRAELQENVLGSLFVAYRNAIVAWVTVNPTFLGAVPSSSLVLPPGFAALSGQGNEVVATPSGAGRIIYTWAALPAGAASQAAQATNEDLSFGTVSGNAWTSPIAGGMGTLGVPVPTGDVVSICQIGI